MIGNKPHVLRRHFDMSMPDHFVFFDTETYIDDFKDEERQRLKLGWAFYWDRLNGFVKKHFFTDVKSFWDFIFSIGVNDLWIFAHNIDFDMKIVDGFYELLLRRKMTIRRFYIEGKVFIFVVESDDGRTFRFYDTMNYIPMSAEKLGAAVECPKISLKAWDFIDKDGKEQKGILNPAIPDQLVKDYCENDVEIIYRFIKNLIYFLQENEIGTLKPTAASQAFEAFRTRFYHPLYIHDCAGAIALERASYRGGITDCFKVGSYIEPMVKLDVNSMYPHIMKKYKSSVRLLHYLDHGGINPDKLFDCSDDIQIIADVTIEIPKEHAYILTKIKGSEGETKSGFLFGKFRETLARPELEYVRRYGKIVKIHKAAVYEAKNIFTEYVDFFYTKRKEYKTAQNDAYVLLTKLFMNSLYGKFAQKGQKYRLLDDNHSIGFGKAHVLRAEGDKIIEYNIIHIGKCVYRVEDTDANSFDSFVAVSSLITSYARMFLIDIIERVGRENVFYTDTDCVIIKESALSRISDLLSDDELGKLKNEGSSNYGKFYRPKYYEYAGVRKCKGVKKMHDEISEDDLSWVISYKNFEHFKTSLGKGSLDFQRVTRMEKRIRKSYDKGEIAENGDVIPFMAV